MKSGEFWREEWGNEGAGREWGMEGIREKEIQMDFGRMKCGWMIVWEPRKDKQRRGVVRVGEVRQGKGIKERVM